MTSILFVCTANRFRSVLAANYFAKKLALNGHHGFQVLSAGTWGINGLKATVDAIRLAQGVNLDVNMHQSKIVTADILSQADLIVVMETGHKEAIIQEFPAVADRVCLFSFLVRDMAYSIPDPYMTDESPEQIANEIFCMIDQGFDKIVHELTGLPGSDLENT